MFKDFYHQIRMKVAFTSVYHTQSNGVVERAHALIFEAIKKILEGKKKGKWAEVMPNAVWSHNTTVSRAINFHHFYCCSELRQYYQKRSSIEAYEQQQRSHPALAKLKTKTYWS
jgi:UDP-3-O-acyl-N-acetylglucosamine deacetylase